MFSALDAVLKLPCCPVTVLTLLPDLSRMMQPQPLRHSCRHQGGQPAAVLTLLPVLSCCFAAQPARSPNRYVTPVVTRVANLLLELPEDAPGACCAGYPRA
jgi:hypothetical protein